MTRVDYYESFFRSVARFLHFHVLMIFKDSHATSITHGKLAISISIPKKKKKKQ